jgi:hypothetical protein
MSEMSMAGPLGGTDGDSEASTTYVGDVDDGPLGGVVEDPGAPTIDTKKTSTAGSQTPVGGPISIRDLKGVL